MSCNKQICPEYPEKLGKLTVIIYLVAIMMDTIYDVLVKAQK